jgi:predicted amidohydrolase
MPRKAATLFPAFLFLILAWLPPASGWSEQTADGVLEIAAVQFAVDEETYADIDSFERRVRQLVESAADAGAELVVFPEYINVFLLFREYDAVIRDSETVEEAIRRIAEREGPPAASLSRLLTREVAEVGSTVRRLWARLAREERVSIVAGTAFVREAPAEGRSGVAAASGSSHGDAGARSGGSIRNRALVFGPGGELIARQDKRFLTPFEMDQAGMSRGSVRESDTFRVDGFDIALTICRDTFFAAWEPGFAHADLWLDIRANGEPYGPQVRDRFDGALPERVACTAVPAGVSTSLTGSFLDFLWQGPAFVVDAEGRRVAESSSPRGTEVLLVSVKKNGDLNVKSTNERHNR